MGGDRLETNNCASKYIIKIMVKTMKEELGAGIKKMRIQVGLGVRKGPRFD